MARRLLLSHAHAEGQEVNPPRQAFEATRELIERAKNDHHSVESLLEQLYTTDYAAPEWSATFQQMASKVERHIEEEENQIFPSVKDLISDDRSDQLKDRFMIVKKRELGVPRPH
jgi:hemerythrin superfamily protein